MNILSYRGPSTPGGVSATLSRIIDQSANGQQWWYLHGAQLRKKAGKLTSTEEVCQIPFKIIEGHYRYCNEFLWPLMHELPQYATFTESDRSMYKQLNMSYALNVLDVGQSGPRRKAFVNDYQLALCPQFLSNGTQGAVNLFWHIPWPKTVQENFLPYIAEIAKGLLSSDKVGFHIEEYVVNFLLFIDRHLKDCKVDFQSSEVTSPNGNVTQVVFHPLGLDSDFWLSKSREESSICLDLNIRSIAKKPFVLSVDRADYTKGIFQRLQAIDHFFSHNPDKIGKITFIQVCQKTRAGLSAYDEYWNNCRFLYESINKRWQSPEWQPIVWIDTPVSPNVLAWLYKRAEVMLVSPVYDGLNLTAKEFALCSKSGVLILSARAGAWNELQEHVLTLRNLRPETISEQLCYALSMSREARFNRMIALKEAVLSNSLANWWHNFGGTLKLSEKVVPLSVKIHHSTKRDLWLAR
ncbi:MAG: hypothetical protein C0507_15695 [Cyanobacteria bacterium PR.3.49]|nr:hypothetical protein [Cyanobacteria bacterium PR.3.49]